MEKVKNVKSPFMYYCAKVIPLAFDESMSYYETLCNFYHYLKEEVMPVINNNAEVLEELQNYVVNYFNNLDVQEEINNKLDQMAEDGTLEAIIGEYIRLATTYVYDNVEDMKEATNLINGSYARTSGFYTLNDGGGAYYHIREIINTDIVDEMTILSLSDENLIAELVVNNTIDVKQLGLNNTNGYEVLTKALDYDIININEDIILLDTVILNGLSNKTINGNGYTISMNHSLNKNLLELTDCNNITFNNVNLTNDDIHTGSTAPDFYFILYGEGNTHINMYSCKIYNPYNNGVAFIKSSYLKFINCEFKDVYYNGLTLLPEVHDVLVDKCLFDTTHTTYTNAYLFSTGSYDYVTEYDYLVDKVTVQNSTFLNNPVWEGIDFHGGSNINILNNYVENCLEGIHYVYDIRPTVVSEYVDNIRIIGNTIINEDLTSNDGIVCTGSSNKYGMNYLIKDNYISGYGIASNKHGINLGYCKQGIISNNSIEEFKYRGIGVNYAYNILVDGNKVNNPYDTTTAQGIFSNVGWLVTVSNNSVVSTNENTYARAISTSNNKGLLILRNNFVLGYTSNKYYSGTNNSTIIGTVGTNSKRLGCKGVISVDENDIPKSYCTDEVVRSVATTSSLTISGVANSNIVSTNGTLANICPYQEIVIEGAGEGGADLTTQIIDIINQTEMILKDNILTTVNDATVSTTASTWVNL